MRIRSASTVVAVLIVGLGLATGAGVRSVHAANTTAEYLVDSDGDGLVDRRPFAGADRYETALRLARELAAGLGGLGSVHSAIVTSGRSPVDAAAAVGLAGREQAPLLLTMPDRLHRGVAEFLDDHGVERVFLVGGPSVLSERVSEQLDALVSDPEVVRLHGEDRYGTAAAVAAQIGSTGRWCASDGAAALLVDGADSSLADAAAAGPLAAGLGLPVVLSSPRGLPDATAQFVRVFDIDRIVIVGDQDRFPPTIDREMSHAGVQSVRRISGTDAASLAAAVASAMRDICAADLRTAPDMAALADPASPTDALVAAPLLGAGIDGGGAVPLLFAGESLPAATAGWLSRTPIEAEQRRVHLHLLALGGYRAVSEAVMDEALAAGATSGPFTATIEAAAGEDAFRVTLSDALNPVEEAGDMARDILYVNGAPAALDRSFPLDIAPGDGCEEPRSFLVRLQRPLRAGDVIELVPAGFRFGVRGDRRPLSYARFEVPEPPRDTSWPVFRVVAPVGSHAVRIVTADDSALDELRFDPTRVVVISARGTPVSVETRFDTERFEMSGLVAFDVDLVAPAGYTRPSAGGTDRVGPGGAYRLEAGDRIFVHSGAVIDAAENRSRTRRSTVVVPQGPLRPVSVQVAPVQYEDADVDRRRAGATFGGALRVTSRHDVDGSVGSRWKVRFGYLSSHDPSAEPVKVKIDVSARDALVSVRFDAGTPTIAELVALLNEHSEFAERFEASAVGECTAAARPVDFGDAGFSGATELRGGVSEFDVTVRFSASVSEYLSDDYVGGDEAREFADDIFAGLIAGYTTTAAAVATGDSIALEAPIPYDHVRFRYATADPSRAVSLVEDQRKIVEIAAGLARGYRADDPATDTDESLSAEVRLRPQFRRSDSQQPRLNSQ